MISPLGNSADALFDSLVAGRSGIRRLEDVFAHLTSPVAATVDFDGAMHFDAPKFRMLDRVSQFALCAARQAMTDAQISMAECDLARIGIALGTGLGGAESTDKGYQTLYGNQSNRVNPFSVLMAMNNAPASWIGLEYGIAGPNLTYSTACSSSSVAIGEAAMRIRNGDADVMIAGGAEAPLTLGNLKAWEALRAMATADPDDPGASCKPFSKNRSGIVLGEGAAILILEEWEHALRRGAPIHAELIGYGLATDSVHLTRPSVGGQARAMTLALTAAGLAPESVDYLNAHGTGTLANDPVETLAIKQIFGEHAWSMPVSSTKSMHGHLLGAAGAIEFVASIMAMTRQRIPPTMHLAMSDPECDLDYVPNQAREACPKTVMSNSFAFGGTNAVLLARKPD